jgi:fatty acid desaturase
MLRVPGWPTAVAAAYAAAGHAGGIAMLLSPPPPSDGLASALLRLAGAAVLLSHARVVAAVLVHDATHDAVFARGWRNTVAGTALLWLAGTPYCYFPHVQKARTLSACDAQPGA